MARTGCLAARNRSRESCRLTDHTLAADVGLRANPSRHLPNERRQRALLLIGMQQDGHHALDDRWIFSALTGGDHRLPPGGLFRCVGTRRGVEQRQLRNAPGRLSENFERDVAAHGKTGERKFLWSGIENDARHPDDRFTLRDRRNTYLCNISEMRNLVAPDRGVADQDPE